MIEIYPYIELNGAWTLHDDHLRECWDQIMADSTDRIFQYDAQPIHDAEAFIEFMKDKDNHVVFVLVDGEPKALAWLSNIEDNHAKAHFLVYRALWGQEITRDMGVKVLNYWFSFPGPHNGYLFETIIGNIAAKNKVAIKYIEKLGFTIMGTIPYMNQVGCCLSYITREDFYEKYPDIEPMQFKRPVDSEAV